MIWNSRPRLIKQNGSYGTGTVIVLAESLPSAVAMVSTSKLSGIPEDLVSKKEIQNLPDVNCQVLCKDIGVWAFPSQDTEEN
jgi:hypothetical protein